MAEVDGVQSPRDACTPGDVAVTASQGRVSASARIVGAVSIALAVLAVGSAVGRADPVGIRPIPSTLEGTNSAVRVAPDGSVTIVSRSTVSPSVNQSATSGQTAGAAGSGGGGDTFTTAPSSNSTSQTSNNSQAAALIIGPTGGGTMIVSRSTVSPSVNQSAVHGLIIG